MKIGLAAQGRVLFAIQSADEEVQLRKLSDAGRKVRPTRLVMEDAMRAGEKSVLEYSEMKLRDLPDKIFTKEYLKKLD
jgi:hypothetical protein